MAALGIYLVPDRKPRPDCFGNDEGIPETLEIYTYIICTSFPTPSRLPVPEVLKLTETEKVAGRMLSLDNLTDEQISRVTGVSLEKIGYLRQLIGQFSS